jgi:phosphohistidine swiveling domain-containing protein
MSGVKMPRYVVGLAECSSGAAAEIGGKAVGLGALLAAGMPVPAGFAVTTSAYRESVAAIRHELDAIAAATAISDGEASAALRALFDGLLLPEPVAAQVREAYLALDPAGPALVAVRSSATAEDLVDASFAGQQDTYLGIRGVEPVIAHVAQCWGSLFTPHAIGYRRRFDVPVDDLAMAVVVQSMVDAEAAGVMMSLDPVTGDRSTVFISAAHGLGEGVVVGDVESDSIWVHKNGPAVTRVESVHQTEAYRYDADGIVRRQPLTAELRDTPALLPREAVELARIATRMEQHQGCPQDLEWAIDIDGTGARRIWLLQSRPETVWANRSTPNRPPALHGPTRPDTTWTTTNVGESVPGIPTPLGWSMWSVAGEIAMRSAFHAIGALSRSELDVPAAPQDRLLGIFLGRASLSVSLLCDWAERVPGTDPVTMAEQIFSARPQGYVPRSRRRYYPRVALKAGVPLFRVKRMVLRDRADAEEFRANALGTLATSDEETTRQILEDALTIHRRCLSTQTLLTMAVCQPITDALLRTAANVGFSGAELMAGYGGHDETAAVTDMWACSRGTLDLDTFLARHGFHAWQEGELSAPSWREDPTPVLNLIESYKGRGDDADPAIAERQHMATREKLESDFLVALPRTRKPLGRLLLRLARSYVPLRGIAKGSFVQSLDVVRAAARRLGTLLQGRGALADREDIFYLTLPELRAEPPADVGALVAERKRERAGYATLQLPTAWSGEVAPIESVPIADDNMIVGSGASPGVAEGRARVVTSPDDAHIAEGEILVAHNTDPSWASLMFLSAGLVADIGGVMSHTAIVARELSLPCVVNTKFASKALRTGDLIRVDGARGTVEVLERVGAFPPPNVETCSPPTSRTEEHAT